MPTTKTPKTLDEAFEIVCQELKDTFVKKRNDYGKGNILSMGELGIAFRETEKVERLKHLLANGNAPNNESLDDTWTDTAVYAVIAIMMRRGWFQQLELKN